MGKSKPKKSDDEISFHPLANIFPLMEGEEFDALVADIKKNGLREKIDLYQGKIVDGRNRHRALQYLGLDPHADDKQYFRRVYTHAAGAAVAPHDQTNDDRVRAYIISKNIHRRHLTAAQKRDLIAKLLKAGPEASNVNVAKQARVDDKTVAKVRRGLEATSEIPRLEKTVGADGKARKQPAKKTSAGSAPFDLTAIEGAINGAMRGAAKRKQVPNATKQQNERAAAAEIGPDSAGERARLQARVDELTAEKRMLEIKCAGLESEVEELRAQVAKYEGRIEPRVVKAPPVQH